MKERIESGYEISELNSSRQFDLINPAAGRHRERLRALESSLN